MSSYLIVKTRMTPDGQLTEAVMRQMTLAPDGNKLLGLLDEQPWAGIAIAGLIATGHSVFVGVPHRSKGTWDFGDEVTVVGSQRDLQSVDDEGLRTYSLSHLPPMD